MAEQQKAFKLGYSSILVPDDEFAAGYSEGYISYPEEEHPLTVEALRKILIEALIDTYETGAWNTGYIVGAIRGIYEGHPSQWKVEPQAHQVQFGSVTLLLNHWLFRSGYEVGQADYHGNQAERTTPRTISAHELLRYLAHYNPKTKRYSLCKEDFSTLEDTLGRLVGYLCAALFSMSNHEQKSEPLSLGLLQEA